jgi:PTS system fructose-specific IIC component
VTRSSASWASAATGIRVEDSRDSVHCVVLLATPQSRRDRHLEVLAAFARAIGGDRNIRHQLYEAESPAHAYQLLHAEESESFNYFLDERAA